MTTKELLALVGAVMVAGCHPVTPTEVATAERACATFGGVDAIPAPWGNRGRLSVYCTDGTYIVTNNTTAKEPK